ncbi:MAG: hypothetical protein A2X78_00735 [Gammaproteobacteria bacterium GWE2_37_16]|nr:MAG: hypothetical protein A2X78_00735 [Gammaproteobacteria bacterium GWE2_37_16]
MPTNSSFFVFLNVLKTWGFKIYQNKVVAYGIMALLLVAILIESRQKTVVVFDFKQTYAIFLKEALNRKLPEDEMRKIGARFPQAVANAANYYAKKHHVIIYTKGAVVAGAEDATPEIQKLIAKEMQKSAR